MRINLSVIYFVIRTRDLALTLARCSYAIYINTKI
jgi:hypothetical protein